MAQPKPLKEVIRENQRLIKKVRQLNTLDLYLLLMYRWLESVKRSVYFDFYDLILVLISVWICHLCRQRIMCCIVKLMVSYMLYPCWEDFGNIESMTLLSEYIWGMLGSLSHQLWIEYFVMLFYLTWPVIDLDFSNQWSYLLM